MADERVKKLAYKFEKSVKLADDIWAICGDAYLEVAVTEEQLEDTENADRSARELLRLLERLRDKYMERIND